MVIFIYLYSYICIVIFILMVIICILCCNVKCYTSMYLNFYIISNICQKTLKPVNTNVLKLFQSISARQVTSNGKGSLSQHINSRIGSFACQNPGKVLPGSHQRDPKDWRNDALRRENLCMAYLAEVKKYQSLQGILPWFKHIKTLWIETQGNLKLNTMIR